MKSLLTLGIFSLAFAIAPSQAAATHAQAATATAEHQHETHAAATPGTLKPGQRWATDAPLREGMGRIRHSVDALGHLPKGSQNAGKAKELAAGIEKDVNFLITNCKLKPEADAALHLIIAKLLKGAHAIKTDPSDPKAVELLREAVADYGRSFDEGPVASG